MSAPKKPEDDDEEEEETEEEEEETEESGDERESDNGSQESQDEDGSEGSEGDDDDEASQDDEGDDAENSDDEGIGKVQREENDDDENRDDKDAGLNVVASGAEKIARNGQTDSPISIDQEDETGRINQKKKTGIPMVVSSDLTRGLANALQDVAKQAAGVKEAEKQQRMAEVLANVFDTLDSDKGGTLDIDGELLRTMQQLGLDYELKDIRIAMEHTVQRKHDRVERVGMFQKRLVWDFMFKEEFIKVMLMLTKPEQINQHKQAEEQIFEVFKQFDVDKSGTIDCNELKQAMDHMGRQMTDDQIENLVLQLDVDGSGSIDFVEFASVFGIKAVKIDYQASDRAAFLSKLADARATFKTFDVDSSDSIDIDELRAIMQAMGQKVTEEQLYKMMETVDTDRSGEIDFKEFCGLLGIQWLDEYNIDLEAIDAFGRANRPTDKRKKSAVAQEVHQVAIVDDNCPPGLTVTSDPSGFKSVRFSPNGKFLGVCCRGGSVKIHEMKSDGRMRRVCSLREHNHDVLSLAWSPSSDRLVTVSADKKLHVWHVKTQTLVQSVTAHSAYVRAVEWSNDGSMIATASSDKTVKLWNPITLERSKLLLGHSNWVRFVRFREDSKRLVSGGDDSYIIVWIVPEGQILQRITGFKSSILDCCLLARESYRLPPLATACLNGEVSMWHPDTGLCGFMHYTIVGIDHMYPAPEDTQRYLIFEVGRNRHWLKTRPALGTTFDYEADTDKIISCSIWNMNEVVRLQLFEVRDLEPVRMIGEFKSTHKELLRTYADGIQQRFHLLSPDETRLTDGGEQTTVLKMKIRFESVDHNANLTVSVEEGKNMKHPDIKGAINTRVTIRTQRGQEYSTDVVSNSKTPQWGQAFHFGIGPTTHEIDVRVDMVDSVKLSDNSTMTSFLPDRITEELGNFQLRMDKLLSKVCSQQEPLSGWYVVRNEVDRKSRGSVRLKFTWAEASNKSNDLGSGMYLGFSSKLSGVRGDASTYYMPRHKISLLNRTLWQSTCRFCSNPAKTHLADGSCMSNKQETGNRVVCMAASSDGVLLAWGTEIGWIFIVNTDTGDQLLTWQAHFGIVESLCFTPNNTVLTSCGVDLKPVVKMEEFNMLTPEQQDAIPRRCSVVNWDLERWMVMRMKSRTL